MVGDSLALTGLDLAESPGDADGPARYRAATRTDAEGWRQLPAGNVIGWDPNWVAVGGRLVNPTPGGSDGGHTHPLDRVLPYGGILDPDSGAWSQLPEDPDNHRDERHVSENLGLGDDQLLVSSTGWVLQPATGDWHALGLPQGGPDEGAAVAVGNGRLYMVGGTRWGRSADLLDAAWVWQPPTPAKAPDHG